MSQEQKTFFFAQDASLSGTLDRISRSQKKLVSYQEFVRELGVLMTTSPAGSLILAGVPTTQAAHDSAEGIVGYMEFAKRHGFCDANSKISEISIPYNTNLRAQQRQLPDVYSAAPVSQLGHRHRPQFMLEFQVAQLQPEPLVRLCSIVDAMPAQFYLVHGAHLLRPAGAAIYEAQNQLRFFAELARRTKRTHVLLANPIIIAQWLEATDIAQEAHACFMRPHEADGTSFNEFIALLKGYDALIPRKEGFELAEKADTIRSIVSGCPYLLAKWVSTAISKVLAGGGTQLSWDMLRHSAPSPVEQKQAKAAFDDIRRLTTPVAAGKAADQGTDGKRRGRRRPGEQKPRRDAVSQHHAA